MRLGIIARADKTGLGNQTRNLVHMLNPSKVMIIDSTSFNGNEQYLDFYNDYNKIVIDGFPNIRQIHQFLRGLDVVLTCETFYNNGFISLARRYRVRTYLQYNYEFLDYLINPNMLKPTKFLAPSKWRLDEMQRKFSAEYLPPPTIESMFTDVRKTNMERKGKPRFMHMVGRQASEDRNGTLDLLASLQYTKSNFELVLKVQNLTTELSITDKRVSIEVDSPEREEELYRDFDATIIPRRYAGLCLPMNESLMSGLPVIMSDVEPNNLVLPSEWLVEVKQVGTIKTRTVLPLYSVDHKAMAKKLDWLCKANLAEEKQKAFELGFNNYSDKALLPKYMEVLK